jgi:hypothetical protein
MKAYQVTMPDGSKWNIPVDVIARNHAQYYADIDYAGDIEKCLREYSLPLLLGDPSEVKDWASGNMDWKDVASSAVRVNSPSKVDDHFQEGWVNGESRVIEVDAQEPSSAPGEPPTLPAADWIRADVALPDPEKIHPSRLSNVETTGKNSHGESVFAMTHARNVVFDVQYCTHWRYLPGAPA